MLEDSAKEIELRSFKNKNKIFWYQKPPKALLKFGFDQISNKNYFQTDENLEKKIKNLEKLLGEKDSKNFFKTIKEF